MRKSRLQIGGAVLLVILVAGCQAAGDAAPTATVDDEAAVTATSLPTPTGTARPTATIPPTGTPEIPPNYAAFTAIPRTPTYIPLPTLPTLTREERLEIARELFTNNAGCRLPCWWGFIPGETKWEEAKRVLESFATSLEEVHQPQGDFSVQVGILVPQEMYFEDRADSVRSIYLISNGVIEAIEIDVPVITTYNLPRILNEYGPPDEIYVATIIPLFPPAQFHVMLFYRKLGILTRYTVTATELDNSMQGCFGDQRSGLMVLWAPDSDWSYKEVKSQLQIASMGGYPLEEATGITIESFYQEFKDGNFPQCIDVPKSYLMEIGY